jgi:tRNA (guanine37-N1)-methyltransferase
MIRFDIITIFPEIFDSYLKESFIKKAISSRKISVKIHNLRDFTKDRHRTVDDKPYGGGLGMVLKVEPIYRAISSLRIKSKKKEVVLFTPRGHQFKQKTAEQFSQLDRIVMICGRYEGVDERVAKKIADKQLSIGPYDLMGGELPAMVVLETVARLIPGVLGKPELLKERIVKKKGFVEYPQYTRPAEFKAKNSKGKQQSWKVPKALLSGNHQEIEKWRKERGEIIG